MTERPEPGYEVATSGDLEVLLALTKGENPGPAPARSTQRNEAKRRPARSK